MLNREDLEELILNINRRTGIRNDILEKDYYVCLVLKSLASKQEQLQAYFKGGYSSLQNIRSYEYILRRY